ncbi:DUF222 domain-containing protein, partial [Microbacterium sp. 22242]|uniref:DUF222 domain-containing protein n=1 Tax=Microbacterium sp. 22242 TaxID=3453896 RepID=UPI003F8593DC
MSSSTGAVVDPGVDPVDPVMVLRMLGESLAVTEAAIVRLQALREAHLGVAQRLAEDLAARSSGSGVVRGEAVDLAARSVAAELAGVLHMSDRVVQGRMARAGDLMARFPQTVRAFSQARINAAHVRLIQDTGGRLDDDVRAGFERLAVAACVGETPHRARRVVERVAERLCPRGLTERHRDAQAGRRVWREDLGDGQKALGLIHSAAVVDGIYDRLTQHARMVQAGNRQAAKNAATAAGVAAGAVADEACSDAISGDSLGDPGDARTIDQL